MSQIRNRYLMVPLILGLALLLPSIGPGVFAQVPDGVVGGTSGSITMHSHFRYPADPSAEPFDQVWLAGYTEDRSGLPTTLGIAWAQEPSAWMPLWYLQLHSDQGLLLPLSPETQIKSAPDVGTEYINLATLLPERGATYETMLSYDGETGALSVWIRNVDRDAVVYSQSLSLSPYAGALYPAAGIVQSGPRGTVGERFVASNDWRVYDRFIPQAADWGLVEVIDGVPQNIVLHAIDRTHSDDIAIRLEKSGASSGQFNFYTERGGQRVPVISVSAAGDDGPYIVPIDRLPVGHSQMVMEYVDDGEVLLTRSRQIRIGRIEAAIPRPKYAAENGLIEGAFVLQADGPIPDVALGLEIELFQLTWDPAKESYRSVSHGIYDVYDGSLALSKEPISIPVAIQPPGEPALWHIQYRLQVEPEILAGTDVRDQLIGTFPEARVADGPPQVPLIIAHRGASGVAPENTLPAFEEAIRIGVDLVEIDVHRTHDGELVVIHDGTVDRTTQGDLTGRVAHLTLEQIKTLDAGSWKSEEYAGAQIPTFRETLVTVQDQTSLLIEGKVTGIERDLAEIIRSLGMEDSVVYQSFSPMSVKAFRHVMPEAPAGVLFGNPGIHNDFQRAATVLTQALDVDASIVAVAYTAVTPAFVRYVQQGGMDVWTWTVNREGDMRRMLDAGVDGIITDYPERLVELLGE